MRDLQTLFNRIQELKHRQRSIRKEYRDLLSQDEEYQRVMEEAKKLRDRKGQIEFKAKESMGKFWDEYEQCGQEIESEQEMLTDVAVTTLMDGKTIEVTDEHASKYEPVFSVKFRKTF